ncbi:MAG: rhodanese-like domain-containing protein [Nitrospiraceae bacterium]
MQHSPAFLRLVDATRPSVRTCTVEDVRHRIDRKEPFRFLDVREESEFANGHARGAEHLGKGIIERDIEALIPDPTTPIVLYCGGGYRSILAADALQRMGYTNVWSMDGGIREWKETKGPMSGPKAM